MDDIVAVKVAGREGPARYYLTWGRVFAPVDTTPLEEAIWDALRGTAWGRSIVSVQVCYSLHEASGEPYFYEGLFTMAQKRIPYGHEYEAWSTQTQQAIREGRELYFLGAREASASRATPSSCGSRRPRTID